jgi:ATP-binding cassette subfamily B protein
VVKAPDIYLFDDSFSALDYDTDARLRAALLAVTARATVIIVAQRISTIRRADSIVVLDQGAVVGTGTHAVLMTSCETYRQIVLSQLSEEEAA